MPHIKAGMNEPTRYLVYARRKMTGLFKCLVWSCAVTLVFGFTNVRDDANWFKNGQRIKNRFVTGVVNGIVDFDCSDSTNGTNVEGECLSKVECVKSGGKLGGLCSLLGSCCVIEKTCSQATSSKVSYFVFPEKFQTDCPLTVNIYSKDVCQIRLDFEKFNIAQPSNREIGSGNQDTGYSSYQCHDDYFQVENVKKNLGFFHLCGANDGQHIYIPISENQHQIVLRFSLKDRQSSQHDLGQPNWRIKIRQLECRKSGYEHIFNAPTKLMAMYNNLKNKKRPKSDWDLIAPPNCLQYYPKKTGIFESFNYNEGKGCYLGRLNYAICFRKTPDICGAKYSASGKFQMNYNKADESEQYDDKCHPKKPASTEVSQDYIRIPGGVTALNYFKDNYCDGDLNDNVIFTKSSEPLYVGVNTDEFRAHKTRDEDEEDDDFQEIGFRIKYELLSGDCNIPF